MRIPSGARSTRRGTTATRTVETRRMSTADSERANCQASRRVRTHEHKVAGAAGEQPATSVHDSVFARDALVRDTV